MKNRRSKLMLLFDTLQPLYVAAVAGMAAYYWIDLSWPASRDALLGAALTFASVIVGFLISAKAIIMSGSGRPFERIKEMGLVPELTDAFAVAIYLAILFAFICTVGFFGIEGQGFEALWVGSGLGMVWGFIKITRLLFRLAAAI
jgi:hypothetical protein